MSRRLGNMYRFACLITLSLWILGVPWAAAASAPVYGGHAIVLNYAYPEV